MKTTIKFQRNSGNPIVPKTPDTFYSIHSANPDILFFRKRYHLYFRGQSESGHDQLGVAYSDADSFDGVHWEMYAENPIIKVSRIAKDFDSGHILDPASIILDEKVYLYYSAHRIDWNDWNVPSYIGLAISEDGTHFEKIEKNPIVFGTAPEVVEYKNHIYLFFQRKNPQGFFEIYCCESEDGIHFSEEEVKKVFTPSKQGSTFDKYSISTVRILREGDWFYMTYGGCDRYFDYPVAIGLARSRDLINWQRYPNNPVLYRGDPGEWDEGALWFATIYKLNNTYFLWYEGVGTGLALSTPENREASRRCREEDYGGYRETAFSQIGLATYHGKLSDWE